MKKIKCPRCGKETEYEGNPFRPFCSRRCKLIDLGQWISGDYKITAEDDEAAEHPNGAGHGGETQDHPQSGKR